MGASRIYGSTTRIESKRESYVGYYIDYTIQSDATSNQSNVTTTLYLYRTNTGYKTWGQYAITIGVGETEKQFSAILYESNGFTNSSPHCVGSCTFTINHNDDGTKNTNITVNGKLHSIGNSNVGYIFNGNTNISLPTIDVFRINSVSDFSDVSPLKISYKNTAGSSKTVKIEFKAGTDTYVKTGTLDEGGSIKEFKMEISATELFDNGLKGKVTVTVVIDDKEYYPNFSITQPLINIEDVRITRSVESTNFICGRDKFSMYVYVDNGKYVSRIYAVNGNRWYYLVESKEFSGVYELSDGFIEDPTFQIYAEDVFGNVCDNCGEKYYAYSQRNVFKAEKMMASIKTNIIPAQDDSAKITVNLTINTNFQKYLPQFYKVKKHWTVRTELQQKYLLNSYIENYDSSDYDPPAIQNNDSTAIVPDDIIQITIPVSTSNENNIYIHKLYTITSGRALLWNGYYETSSQNNNYWVAENEGPINSFCGKLQYSSESGTSMTIDYTEDNLTQNTSTKEWYLNSTIEDIKNGSLITFEYNDSISRSDTVSTNVTLRPVFDWSNEDFDFNVPVFFNQPIYLKYPIDAKNINVNSLSLVDFIYPVGSIYMSLDANFKPDVFFGGYWSKIEDRFLLGAIEGQSPGDLGGKKSHNHSISEHTHSAGSLRAAIGAFEGNTNSLGYTATGKVNGVNFTYGGSNTFSPTVNGIDTEKINHFTAIYGSTASAGSGTTGDSSNMPPYITVNIWQRVG